MNKDSKKDEKDEVEKKTSEETTKKSNESENKNLKNDFEKLRKSTNLTEDEIFEINRLLEKIDNSENKSQLSRKDIDKRTVFHVVRKIFFSYLIYAVFYFSMFGLFGKWFTFEPRYVIAYVTLSLAGYMVIFRYVCRLITAKTHHYISIYNIFSLITILLLYEAADIIPGFKINGFIVIIVFYYVSEILITIAKRYLFKYLPSKLMWRNKK